jgi:hypothetical protein
MTRSLPTTAADVQADLEARSTFRSDDKAMHIHYLYGMSTQLLAQANERNERLLKALRALVAAGNFAVESDDDVAITLRLGQATDEAMSAIFVAEHF